MSVEKKIRTLEDQLFEIGLVLLIAGGISLLCYEMFLKEQMPVRPCLFFNLLGIYCPGCGGTRAVEALLHGHLLQALWFHPLVPYAAVICGGFMGSHVLHRLGLQGVRGWKFHNWYLYAAIVIIAVNFVGKNILKFLFGITM